MSYSRKNTLQSTLCDFVLSKSDRWLVILGHKKVDISGCFSDNIPLLQRCKNRITEILPGFNQLFDTYKGVVIVALFGQGNQCSPLFMLLFIFRTLCSLCGNPLNCICMVKCEGRKMQRICIFPPPKLSSFAFCHS